MDTVDERIWADFERENREARDLERRRTDYLHDEAAFWDVADMEEPAIRAFFGPAFFGGVLAMAFACFERLVADMVEEAEEMTGRIESESSDGKPRPIIDRGILFLVRVCGMPEALSKEQRKRLDAFRTARNRLVHQLGRVDLPKDVGSRLGALLGSDGETLRIDASLARGALDLVDELGFDLAIQFHEHFGQRVGEAPEDD